MINNEIKVNDSPGSQGELTAEEANANLQDLTKFCRTVFASASLDGVANDKLQKSTSRYALQGDYFVAIGGGGSYSLSSPATAGGQLQAPILEGGNFPDGIKVRFICPANNTGAVVIQISNESKSLKKGPVAGIDLEENDLQANQLVECYFDRENDTFKLQQSVNPNNDVNFTQDMMVQGTILSPQVATTIISINPDFRGTANSNAGLTLSSVGAVITADNQGTSHGLREGDGITITGANEAGYNGTYNVSDVVSASVFKYEVAIPPVVSTATGTIVFSENLLRYGVNVASVSRVSAGRYLVLFTTPYTSNRYVVTGTCRDNSPFNPTGNFSPVPTILEKTKTSYEFIIIDNSPAEVDIYEADIVILGGELDA